MTLDGWMDDGGGAVQMTLLYWVTVMFASYFSRCLSYLFLADKK